MRVKPQRDPPGRTRRISIHEKKEEATWQRKMLPPKADRRTPRKTPRRLFPRSRHVLSESCVRG